MNPRPYASPGRDAAAARTRARLVRVAARHLRAADGLGGLSLESVAREAGVSRVTVYNQFGSRRGLLEAVFDDTARRGGIHRLPSAMADPDPRAGLTRLVEIFCEFWNFDRMPIGRLHAAGAADAELEAAVRARNERRRSALSVLVGRLVAQGQVRTAGAGDLTDVLFVLTSFAVFNELAAGKRKAKAACDLIKELVDAAVTSRRT